MTGAGAAFVALLLGISPGPAYEIDPDPLPRALQRPVLLGYEPPVLEEPEPETSSEAAGGALYGMFLRLGDCETGALEVPGSADWSYNGPSGYDGGIQFHPGTWIANGGGRFAPFAWGATRDEQITIGIATLERSGWGQWPGCAAALGYM